MIVKVISMNPDPLAPYAIAPGPQYFTPPYPADTIVEVMSLALPE